MIRRKPTALVLTHEDIAIYEDARSREAMELEQQAQMQQAQLQQQQRSSQAIASSTNASTTAASRNRRGESVEDVFWTGSNAERSAPAGNAQVVRTRDERLGLGMGRPATGQAQGRPRG